jgi:hypothetical protein
MFATVLSVLLNLVPLNVSSMPTPVELMHHHAIIPVGNLMRMRIKVREMPVSVFVHHTLFPWSPKSNRI